MNKRTGHNLFKVGTLESIGGFDFMQNQMNQMNMRVGQKRNFRQMDSLLER